MSAFSSPSLSLFLLNHSLISLIHSSILSKHSDDKYSWVSSAYMCMLLAYLRAMSQLGSECIQKTSGPNTDPRGTAQSNHIILETLCSRVKGCGNQPFSITAPKFWNRARGFNKPQYQIMLLRALKTYLC